MSVRFGYTVAIVDAGGDDGGPSGGSSEVSMGDSEEGGAAFGDAAAVYFAPGVPRLTVYGSRRCSSIPIAAYAQQASGQPTQPACFEAQVAVLAIGDRIGVQATSQKVMAVRSGRFNRIEVNGRWHSRYSQGWSGVPPWKYQSWYPEL